MDIKKVCSPLWIGSHLVTPIRSLGFVSFMILFLISGCGGSSSSKWRYQVDPTPTPIPTPTPTPTPDPLAPHAPSNLTATPASSSQINLNWIDNSDNEDGFHIERSLHPHSGFEWIARTTSNLTTHTDTQLSSHTTYYYRVRAFNSVGPSGYSNVAHATTFQLPPNAPSNLTATPIDATQIALTWIDHADNEEGFRLERSLSPSFAVSIHQIVAPNITTFLADNLSPNTRYYFRVRAFNSAGNSDYSNVANARTHALPPHAPSNLTAETLSSFQIRLTWQDNSNDETGFRIYRATNPPWYQEIEEVSANGTQFINTGLHPGRTYYYRVTAFNAAGESPASNGASARTLDATIHSDVFEQSHIDPDDKVDILWVIDDSGSMSQEQLRINQNAARFTNILQESQSDFHLIVITTDASNNQKLRSQCQSALGQPPNGPGIITSATASAFASCAIVGTNGSSREEGIAASAIALWPDHNYGGYAALNPNFLRPDAPTHVIYVSDEEDQHKRTGTRSIQNWPGIEQWEIDQWLNETTYDPGDSGRLWVSPGQHEPAFAPILDHYEEFFHSLKDPAYPFTAHAIYTTPGCSQGAQISLRYPALAERTNGSTESICTPDWSGVMENLGLQVSGLQRCFILTHVPSNPPESIFDVKVNGEPRMHPNDWWYESEPNRLCFTEIPPPDAIIEVDYF